MLTCRKVLIVFILKSRGNDILGINNGLKADDNLPYATISYANGPGHASNVNQQGRKDLLKTNMHDGVSNSEACKCTVLMRTF